MYRNQEVVHSGEPGEGVSFVINGIVKVACIDMQDTQDYFLGSGQFLIYSQGLGCVDHCDSQCVRSLHKA